MLSEYITIKTIQTDSLCFYHQIWYNCALSRHINSGILMKSIKAKIVTLVAICALVSTLINDTFSYQGAAN